MGGRPWACSTAGDAVAGSKPAGGAGMVYVPGILSGMAWAGGEEPPPPAALGAAAICAYPRGASARETASPKPTANPVAKPARHLRLPAAACLTLISVSLSWLFR